MFIHATTWSNQDIILRGRSQTQEYILYDSMANPIYIIQQISGCWSDGTLTTKEYEGTSWGDGYGFDYDSEYTSTYVRTHQPMLVIRE